MTDDGRTISRADADFLTRVADSSTSTGLYLERADRARFKRMRDLDMVLGGRLDPDRYALLTPKGRQFVAAIRR